jgi:programmed cell death protein 5
MSKEPNEDRAKELEIQRLKESMLRAYLTPEARQRLANVRMVKPDLANAVENYIITMASQGRLREVSDEDLKRLLLALQKPKRDFKINYR